MVSQYLQQQQQQQQHCLAVSARLSASASCVLLQRLTLLKAQQLMGWPVLTVVMGLNMVVGCCLCFVGCCLHSVAAIDAAESTAADGLARADSSDGPEHGCGLLLVFCGLLLAFCGSCGCC
jgi:hypothetical protein